MRIFGLEIKRAKAAAAPFASTGRWDDVSGPWGRFGGWLPGWFQRDEHPSLDTVLGHTTVFACVTLIAGDIAKLRWRIMEQDRSGIWSETDQYVFDDVLDAPNGYQTGLQFRQTWALSLLLAGNAYILIQRDEHRVVKQLFPLDPQRVEPLVTPEGGVVYRLQSDNLSGLQEPSVIVPASEIIHDRMNCLFHPLIGLSPIFAAGFAASQGLSIQRNSRAFFANGCSPGGILTAPGDISDDLAALMKQRWEANYTGDKAGRVAVLGNGLSFEPLRMTSVDAQLIEQQRWTDAVICSAFHVPAFMVGVGTEPSFANAETRTQHYYSQCLQAIIEGMEAAMDRGLGLALMKIRGKRLRTELDLDGLLRMDTATMVTSLKTAVDGAIMTPNEARLRMNLKPLAGGDTVYMQQQNYSLQALDARDRAGPAPSSGGGSAPAARSTGAPELRNLHDRLDAVVEALGPSALSRYEQGRITKMLAEAPTR